MCYFILAEGLKTELMKVTEVGGANIPQNSTVWLRTLIVHYYALCPL